MAAAKAGAFKTALSKQVSREQLQASRAQERRNRNSKNDPKVRVFARRGWNSINSSKKAA